MASRDGDLAKALRRDRDVLVADERLGGADFGSALADAVDATLQALLARAGTQECAVVALGSYARRELCPGSDIDVLLVLPTTRRMRRAPDHRSLTETLWYPLWDAGFTTGHGARTIRESIALADEDLDALTALLEVRHVAGEATLTADLASKARAHARRRAKQSIEQLAGAAALRRVKPGPIAEMLEPNLKDGAGGIRDIQALGWAGVMLGDGSDGCDGIDAMVARGAVSADDASHVRVASEYLLRLRVALHRVNGARGDLLALQDQDAVAAALSIADADVLVHDLAATARAVAWTARDAWAAIDSHLVENDVVLEDRVMLRRGRVVVTSDASLTAAEGLQVAALAAERDRPFDAATLAQLAAMPPPTWTKLERTLFDRLLRAGRRAVPVFEALDHVGALVRILPEWEHVRSLPQRNAYHRFTVDRHSLEAVAECAALLDLGDIDAAQRPFDGVAARACRRPELLLLGALFHDIGKGLPGDHATIGSETAGRFAKRIGLDSEAVEILRWLVRDHLLMADTATRRDLSDESTVRRFCEVLAGDAERLRLLYLLTIGDSIATGPAAWSQSKAALLRDLFVKAAAVVEFDTSESIAEQRFERLAQLAGVDAAKAFLSVLPSSYLLGFEVDVIVAHMTLLQNRELAVDCDRDDAGRVVVTVVAPDRPGLLSTVAGALTCCGLAVQEASLFSTADGMALDVFRAVDTYGRMAEGGDDQVRSTIARAFSGELDVAAGVAERQRHYPRAPITEQATEIAVDFNASDTATVIEVHTFDQVGLLFRLARGFAALDLDVRVAKVATLGERVVDVFYVRDANGAKLVDVARLAELERRIRADTVSL